MSGTTRIDSSGTKVDSDGASVNSGATRIDVAAPKVGSGGTRIDSEATWASPGLQSRLSVQCTFGASVSAGLHVGWARGLVRSRPLSPEIAGAAGWTGGRPVRFAHFHRSDVGRPFRFVHFHR